VQQDESEFYAGETIEAQWDDGNYYKARVNTISGKRASITFLDYAQTSELALTQLRKSLGDVPEDLSTDVSGEPEELIVEMGDDISQEISYEIGEEVESLYDDDSTYYKAVIEKINDNGYQINFPEYDETLTDVPLANLRKLETEKKTNIHEVIVTPVHTQNDGFRQVETPEIQAKLSDHIITLNQGRLFTKHGRSGKKNKRWVWLSEDLQYIRWDASEQGKERELGEKNKGRSLKTYTIIEVKKGAKTQVLKKAMSRLSSFDGERFGTCCFSIILKDRSVDLEAENETLRDAWYERFVWLQSYTGPGTPMGDGWLEREKLLNSEDMLGKDLASANNEKKSRKFSKLMFSPKRSSQEAKLEAPPEKKEEVYEDGEEVEAMYDGTFYDAIIDFATETGYSVTYTEYQEQADLTIDQIRRKVLPEFNPDLVDVVQEDMDSEKKAQAMGLLEYLSALGDGGMFVHHEKKGSAKNKFIVATADMQFIKWGSNREKALKPNNKNKFFKSSEITQIAKGCTTETFEKCMKDHPDASAIASRSLSIVYGDHSLDLEAKDEASADHWIDRFKWLEQYQKSAAQ